MNTEQELYDEELDDREDKFFEELRFTADPGQSLVRIDKFLIDRIENATRNKIQSGIREGLVKVNDGLVKPSYMVKPNDVILVVVERYLPPGEIIAEDLPLDIRYEDRDLLVLYKPADLVVHPGVGNHTGTLVNGLAFHFEKLPKMEGSDEQIGLVHRIDKNTSGLLVVAKTVHALSFLQKQFAAHTTHRRYIALAWGDLPKDEGTITGHIGRHPQYRKMRHVFPDGETGKYAVTHYKVLRRFGYTTLVECRLETGRTHQIRVHFKHIGHPLFNDELYGGDRIVKGTVYSKYKQFIENCFQIMPRQALHAKSLGFMHPSLEEFMIFEAEMPDDFERLLNKWERYTAAREAGSMTFDLNEA